MDPTENNGNVTNELDKKAVFAAIIGRPNVGKSTLLNALVGEKVSIVTNKPQTTRSGVTGILTKGDTQFVFLDTPGLHKAKDRLGAYMMKSANSALEDTDVVIWVVPTATRPGKQEEFLANKLKAEEKPVILVINKTDGESAVAVGDTILAYAPLLDFASVIPASALTGKGVDIVLDELSAFAQPGGWIFDEDMITDSSQRTLAGEIIREKLLRVLNDEIPHGIAVTVEEFREKRGVCSIRAEIICEKASHKPIIIGKGGATLKKVGTYAREDMEKLFESRVFLDLYVRVREGWRDGNLSKFGFDD